MAQVEAAFPDPARAGNTAGFRSEPEPGMSLRDWFASQAMGDLISSGEGFPLIADQAYLLADEMMKSREKPLMEDSSLGEYDEPRRRGYIYIDNVPAIEVRDTDPADLDEVYDLARETRDCLLELQSDDTLHGRILTKLADRWCKALEQSNE